MTFKLILCFSWHSSTRGGGKKVLKMDMGGEIALQQVMPL